MYRRSIISLSIAVVLITGLNGPLVSADPSSDSGGAVVTAYADTPDTTASQPEKKGGNAFVRVITAPFRAIGKLFSGGDNKTARKKSTNNTANAPVEASGTKDAATAQQASGDGKQGEAVQTNALEDRTNGAVQPVQSSVQAGTRIIRPGESVTPGIWIPVIEGIPKDHLSQGRALLQHGYLNEAIAELSIAASVGPNLVEANNLLALAYDRRGWHKVAIETYERARQLAPDDPVVLANLGYSHYLDDNYREALKYLKRAARRAPDAPVIHNNIGIVLARVGKFDDAFKSFARAAGEYDAHLKIAEILEQNRRDKEAIKHYEAALHIQPDATVILERLAPLYERTNRPAQAEAARRALGQPRNPQRTNTGGG